MKRQFSWTDFNAQFTSATTLYLAMLVVFCLRPEAQGQSCCTNQPNTWTAAQTFTDQIVQSATGTFESPGHIIAGYRLATNNGSAAATGYRDDYITQAMPTQGTFDVGKVTIGVMDGICERHLRRSMDGLCYPNRYRA